MVAIIRYCYYYNYYLLTLLGSIILSLTLFVVVVVVEFGFACESELHWLSTSSDSFLTCCLLLWSSCISFSSLMLLWSDGVEGFDEETVGPVATAIEAISSLNIDKNCSSSNLSNSPSLPLLPGSAAATGGAAPEPPPRHSSSIGASRNVMESLTDLRWDPRLAVEKSRNSSTQEGFVAKEGSFVCETTSGQLGTVMFGIFGGNCAIIIIELKPTNYYQFTNWPNNSLSQNVETLRRRRRSK